MDLENIWELLLALAYFGGSALYEKWKRKESVEADQPEAETATSRRPEPSKSTGAPASPPAHGKPVEEAQISRLEPPQRPPSVRPALSLTIDDWERAARVVLKPDEVGRVRHTLEGMLPGFSPGISWSAEDERVGELYQEALRQLTERVEDGASGASLLIGRTCAELLNPLLEDLHEDPGTEAAVVLPLSWHLEGNAAMLAQLCGFEPVLIPEGTQDALAIFGIIQRSVVEILLDRGEASHAVAKIAREVMVDYLTDAEGRDEEVVRALQRYGGVALVVQGMVAAWVVRGTGPLLSYGLEASPGGLGRSVPPGLVRGLCDLRDEASNAQSYLDDSAVSPSVGWRGFCARIEDALDFTPIGHSNRPFGSYAASWTGTHNRECADLIQWTETPGRSGNLGGKVDSRSALMAFVGLTARESTVAPEECLSRLKIAVLVGISSGSTYTPREPLSGQKPFTPRGYFSQDAFLLQLILGPPRSHGRLGLSRPKKTSPRAAGRSLRV